MAKPENVHTDTFAMLAPILYRNGYEVVAIPRGTKKAWGNDWGHKDGSPQTQEDVDELIRMRPQDGIGILARNTPGIDIDVRRQEIADKIHNKVMEIVGTKFLVRYGAPPKRLLPVRVEERFTKVQTKDYYFKGEVKGKDKPTKVEILADGQQWVAYAIHPDTHKAYAWVDGGPVQIKASELPLLTQEQAKAIVAAATAILEEHGAKPAKTIREQGSAAPKKSGSGFRATEEMCREALAKIPNVDLSRDDWVYMCHVIKGAGLSLDDWREFSGRSPKMTNQATGDRIWESCEPSDIGAGTLVHIARGYGWRPSAPPPGNIIDELNKEYAVVLVSNKALIMQESYTRHGLPTFKLLAFQSFKLWLANRSVTVDVHKQDKDGNDVITQKEVPLADYWNKSDGRRQYRGIEFAPSNEREGYYNLWKGFGVKPKAGDCSKFLAHVRENICSNDGSLYDWVIGWVAAIFQAPDKKGDTALALRGKMGTGKTVFAEIIGKLLGIHYVKAADPRYITGQFNSHLMSCILLHGEEAFWAGDKHAEGKLKDLVSGKAHPIEFKGIEPEYVDNYVRLLITGNPDWVVPAGLEERRFATIDVGEAHMADHEYFAAIEKEMLSGGYEALLHFLLHFDLSHINLRVIPKTQALLKQKIASLSTEQSWWLDILQNAMLPGGEANGHECPSTLLFDSYVTHAQKTSRHSRKSIETQIGMFLRDFAPGVRCWPDRNYADPLTGKSKRCRMYVFPTLGDCRTEIDRRLGQRFDWSVANDWLSACDPEELAM